MTDVLGRSWQMGTIQLDRADAGALRAHLHGGRQPGAPGRSSSTARCFGSLERFIGILIEHYGGAFPFWLSPVQVRILPVGEAHHDGAQTIALRLREAGYRAEVDEPTETIGKRIRDAEMQKIPFVVVYGDRESEESLAVRERGGAQETLSLADLVTKLATL